MLLLLEHVSVRRKVVETEQVVSVGVMTDIGHDGHARNGDVAKGRGSRCLIFIHKRSHFLFSGR